MKKYNAIQLTKNKMDLNNRKITNHPPSPVSYMRIIVTNIRLVSLISLPKHTKSIP